MIGSGMNPMCFSYACCSIGCGRTVSFLKGGRATSIFLKVGNGELHSCTLDSDSVVDFAWKPYASSLPFMITDLLSHWFYYDSSHLQSLTAFIAAAGPDSQSSSNTGLAELMADPRYSDTAVLKLVDDKYMARMACESWEWRLFMALPKSKGDVFKWLVMAADEFQNDRSAELFCNMSKRFQLLIV